MQQTTETVALALLSAMDAKQLGIVFTRARCTQAQWHALCAAVAAMQAQGFAFTHAAIAAIGYGDRVTAPGYGALDRVLQDIANSPNQSNT